MKTIKTSAMSLMLALLTSTTLLAQNETASLVENETRNTTTTSYQANTSQSDNLTDRTSFAIGLYRVQQSLTMRLTMDKQAGERVIVRLLNANGQVMHQEVVSKAIKKYACNFDFSNTQDGQFTIQVANGNEVLTKAINLTTNQVVETPSRILVAQN